jgi:alcohol dehydrogenase class IV
MYEINNPTKVIFARGISRQLKDRVLSLGTKPFVVSYEDFPSPLPVSFAVRAEPDMRAVEQGRDMLKEQGCDVVVAVGGGSVIDAAKGIALLAVNEGSCMDFLDPERIQHPSLPVVAVPTTAGTGSEVTKYAVFNDRENKKKYTIKSQAVCPALALVDPDLTHSLPDHITKATASDALVHCVEGYCNIQGSPYTKTLAEWGMQTIPRALSETSREELMFAATVGGIVITNARTGIIHTMSAALEPYCNLQHGEVVGRIMPYVLDLYRQHGVSIPSVESVYGRVNFQDQGLNRGMIEGFVERVLMDKGLPDVSPVPITPDTLTTLFSQIL